MPMFSLEARLKRQALLDLLFRNLTRVAAFCVLALLGAIIGSLVVGSMPAIHAFGFGFLSSSDWDPVNDKFGALIPIIGTLVTSGIALLIAIPVSFGIAVFLTELSPRVLRRPLGCSCSRHYLPTISNPGSASTSVAYPIWGHFFPGRQWASACCPQASFCRSW
jgi:ABC-type phosphate transport system permease subunit